MVSSFAADISAAYSTAATINHNGTAIATNDATADYSTIHDRMLSTLFIGHVDVKIHTVCRLVERTVER